MTTIANKGGFLERCVSYDSHPSVEHTGLVGRHHVFDIYESIFSPVALKHFQSLLDQVTNVLPPVLAVVDAISGVNWERRGTQTHTQDAFSARTARFDIKAHKAPPVAENTVDKPSFHLISKPKDGLNLIYSSYGGPVGTEQRRRFQTVRLKV